MSIRDKTTGFTLADFEHLAHYAGLPRGRERRVLERTCEALSSWEQLAIDLCVPRPLREHVLRTLRLDWGLR